MRGFDVFEANPLARWLFNGVGLFEGLLIETLVTSAAIAFLVVTHRVPSGTKLLLLGFLAALPAWAVANNMAVMHEVGISLWQ